MKLYCRVPDDGHGKAEICPPHIEETGRPYRALTPYIQGGLFNWRPLKILQTVLHSALSHAYSPDGFLMVPDGFLMVPDE